jgi:hypothetical protein
MASTTRKRLTVNEALAKALEDATEPMKAKDIIDGALPLTSLKTKTPRATIAHALSVEARKDDGLFERTGAGMYRLREKKSPSPVTDKLLAEAGKDEVKSDPKPSQKRTGTRKRSRATAAA